MSRFTQAAATMHTLSLAAMEEASRLGLRDADIDHLLLALTIDPDTGGQVLRSMGVSLHAARAAVGEQHAAQLNLVGLAPDASVAGRIVFHETSGYEWTDRAVAVLKAASGGDRRGDSAAVLGALIDEPSGLVAAVLQRLDVDPDAVQAHLDDLRRIHPAPSTSHRGHALSASRSIFAPAPLEEVWMLVSSADRIPEWDQGVAEVDADDGESGVWEARTRTTAHDGRRIAVKDAFLRQRIQLVERAEQMNIVWRFTHPDAARANPRRIAFALEHAAGGTQLRVTLTWETGPRRRGRRILRALVKPLHRLALFIQLAQIESGITRVFR